MPAFRRRQKSSAVVGRLIAGYGDLELLLAICVGMALASKRKGKPGYSPFQNRVHYEHIGLQLMYRIKGGSQRIRKAKATSRPEFVRFGLQTEFDSTIAAMNLCRFYRNLFTHSLWGQSNKRGLFFVPLEEHAHQAFPLQYKFRHASQQALDEIEAYFWATFRSLDYLGHALPIKAGLYRPRLLSAPPTIPALRVHTLLLPYKSPH